MAGVAGAFIDREFESKGLDAIDGFKRVSLIQFLDSD